jgi:hypothetical protein
MWKEYFPRAKIYGVDIRRQCKQHEEDRIKIFIGDQGNKNFLEKIVKEIGSSLHIVIDDGGHKSDLQIPSFEVFFPHLVPGGVYVIEDLYATSGLTPIGDTHEYFKRKIDEIMRTKQGQESPIESISFHRPATSGALMFVQKREKNENTSIIPRDWVS